MKKLWLSSVAWLLASGCGGGSKSSDEVVSSTTGIGTNAGPVVTGTAASGDVTGSVGSGDASSTAVDGTVSPTTGDSASTSDSATSAGGAGTSSSTTSAATPTSNSVSTDSGTATETVTTGEATTTAATSGATVPDGAPAPGTYGNLATLPESNSEMAVAEADGIIYVIGGYPSSRVTQTTVQIYDPLQDTWALVEPLPVAIHHPVAVGYASKIYSLGGQTDNGDTDRTLVYDPANDTWTDLSPMPAPRGAGAAAVIDDQIYVVGGRPPALNAFEVYDVGDDSWTPLADLPTDYNDRNHLAAAAIGGKVYVAGGRYDGGSFSSPMTDALDVYDPASNTWTRAASMLRPRGGVNGIAAYGCFYVWGGEGANTGETDDVFPDHDVYNPLTDEWTSLAPLPQPIHGVTGAAFVNGLIYMPGGGTQQGGSSGSDIFQVYNPAMRCE